MKHLSFSFPGFGKQHSPCTVVFRFQCIFSENSQPACSLQSHIGSKMPAKNKFVPVFSYFIKLSPTNAFFLTKNPRLKTPRPTIIWLFIDHMVWLSFMYGTAEILLRVSIKTDTSLRPTVVTGPEGVRLR